MLGAISPFICAAALLNACLGQIPGFRSITIDAKGDGEVVVTVDGKELSRSKLMPGVNKLSVPSQMSPVLTGRITAGGRETLFVIHLRGSDTTMPEKAIPLEITERGTVQIGSFPTEASIFWDKENTGRRTNTVLKDKVGSHSLTLQRSGYKDWHKEIHVQPDKGFVVFAELESL